MYGVSTIRAFLLGGLAIGFALWGQRLLEQSAFVESVLIYAAALIMAVWALQGFSWSVSPLLTTDTPPAEPAWWRFLPAIVALALAWLALRNLTDVERPSPLFWRLHLTSIALFLAGALLLDSPASFRLVLRRSLPGWQATGLIAMLALILLLAAFLRLWQFDELPFGTWYDEAENGLQALRILENPSFRPIFVGSIHAPAHYVYLIVAAFEWAGVSTQSIRLVSVAMGLITVLAAYLVGRELFGRAGGVMLAFLLAVSRWNVNFSRIGMYNASTPMFELLTIGFLLRGLRLGHYRDYALAGLFLGLGLCFYAAFQLFVGVLLLFLLALMLLQRGFWRRSWRGLLVLVCTAMLVIAPVIKFAYTKPDVYFERTMDTSIFAKKRPEERLPALLENTRKHLLMFNVRGDPNGRHNLPGKPMLDPYSAALMVLGLALALWRLGRGPGRAWALLVPTWLGITLLGGILSLDFEAPQSLRAIGTQPAVYVLAVAPLVALWRAWRAGAGRYTPNFVIAPLTLLLGLAAYSNFHTYFFEQAVDFATWNSFSTPETITARLLASYDEQTDAYVISFFHGHPTLNFLARTAPRPARIETTDHLPLPWPASRPVALITNADSRSLFDEARRYYPNAHLQEYKPPFGGPTVLYEAVLTPADIAGVQGLAGNYYPDTTWTGPSQLGRQDAMLRFDWANTPPLPLPFSVEWEGVLRIETYGPHQFFLQAPAESQLLIGEELVLATSGAGETSAGVVLAQGNHPIRVRAVGAPGPFSLAWRPPDRGPEIVPATALYVPPVVSNGLLGRYFANDSWQTPEAFAKIDPQLNLYFHIPPLARPYTVEWTGKIAIPLSGFYHFGLESIDEATLWIDEQPITASTQPNVYADGAVELTAGLHDIRIRYTDRTDHTHINLYWTPPGATMQLVPAEVLFPPLGNYQRMTMPSLDAFVFNPLAPAAPLFVTRPLAGTVRTVQSGLNQPRGIAVAPDGRIYVADTGNRRVLVLSPAGAVTDILTPGRQPFVEPFDLAVDRQGNLYVLDAGQARIAIFDRDGGYLRDLPASPTVLDRARGLHLDGQDRIWVADTPGGRVVAFDQAGQIVLEIPVWPGQASQPVDVAVGFDGTIFVTDAGLHKLVHFDASGRRLLAWEIPVANTMDGSHLAVDGVNQLYITQPEMGQIALHRADGEQIGVWPLHAVRAGGIVKPVGVAVDADGRIWSVDSAGGAVIVVEPEE
jgi:DNA-binding beta-propeller fold protein YncE